LGGTGGGATGGQSSGGSDPGVTLVSSQDRPADLAVDSTHLYWVNRGGGQVMRIDLGGSTVEQLAATGADPAAVALSASRVYWTDSTQLASVDKGGGTPTQVVAIQAGVVDLAVYGANAFYANATTGAVRSVPLSGGPSTPLAASQTPGAVAVDDSYLYWINTGASGSLRKVLQLGGTVTAMHSDQAHPTALTLDDTSAYWARDGGSEIVSGTLVGGDPVAIASGQAAAALAVDDSHVYWTDAATGGVQRAPLAGGPVEEVAGCPVAGGGAIVTGPSAVYWICGPEESDGRIMTVPK
jgi:streptogramin lyase